MNKTSAFTLIEVMTVLVVLSLVAILSYTFMGSVIRDARTSYGVTKIYNDLRKLCDAYEDHYRRTGEKLDEIMASDVTYIKDIPELYSGGHLRSVIQPPQEIFDPAGGIGWNYEYRLLRDIYQDHGGPTTAKDPQFSPVNITVEACQLFNDRYSSLGVGAAIPSAPGVNVGPHCWKSSETNRRIVMVPDYR